MNEDIPTWVKVLIWVLVVPFFGWLYLAVKRIGTLVDVRGIQVRAFVRKKRLDWAEVQDIRAEPNIVGYMQSGAPTLITAVLEPVPGRGVRVRRPAPPGGQLTRPARRPGRSRRGP
ncbi:hypothetical protein [Streptomyces sp. NPDC093544]|uniref:hypothetical protein n=1 Tax=Streptomyces sp. NPDC093544 TaxID=3155200 RepID=UPI003418C84F